MNLEKIYEKNPGWDKPNLDKLLIVIEEYIISSDMAEFDLEKSINKLNYCFVQTKNSKERSDVLYLFSKAYQKIENYEKAYFYLRLSLYFKKNKNAKIEFKNISKDFGMNDMINDDSFNFKLLKNINFKCINHEPYEFSKNRNNVKFKLKNKIVNVEQLAIDYYKKRGYEVIFAENDFLNLLHYFVLFQDLNGKLFFDIGFDEYNYLYNERLSELNENNISAFFKKYLFINKLNYNGPEWGFEAMVQSKKMNVKNSDDLHNVFVKLVSHLGVEKTVKLLKQKKYNAHFQGRLLPDHGLPDLMVFNDKEFFFVEVKSTNDKLSSRQKYWHMYISEILDMKIELFLVNKSEKQIKSMKNHYLL